MAIRQEGNTYYGLSTDTKPTGAVLNGREFKEMDTGKKYLFDAENGEWLEQPEEGGGGGGGSSTLSGLTDVDISNPSDGQTLVFNSASGKWENGGNMPTPSASNVGGALSVIKTKHTGATIAPSQTVTLTDHDDGIYAVLQNANLQLFTVGQEITVNFNGASVSGIINYSADGMVTYVTLWPVIEEALHEISLVVMDNSSELRVDDFYGGEGDSFSIAVNAVEYAYQYGLDPYPGYDAVLELDNATLKLAGNVSLVKGNIIDLIAKADRGAAVNILAYGLTSEASGHNDVRVFNVLMARFGSYVGEGELPYVEVDITDSNAAESAYASSSSGGTNNKQINFYVVGTQDRPIRRIEINAGGAQLTS